MLKSEQGLPKFLATGLKTYCGLFAGHMCKKRSNVPNYLNHFAVLCSIYVYIFIYIYLFIYLYVYIYVGLFKIIVGVLTTCHTQYT